MDIQLDDLLKSYLACRQHKRNTKAALEFEADWESNLIALYRELTEDRYVLQCDLRGFFMSIDRQQLAGMLDDFLGLRYTGIDLDTLRRLTRQVASADPLIQVSVKGHSGCLSPAVKAYIRIDGLTKVVSASRIRQKARHSVDRECRRRIRLLKQQNPGVKIQIDYNAICNEIWMERRYGIKKENR